MDRMSLVRWGGVAGLLHVGGVLAAAIVGLAAGHDPQDWARQDTEAILAYMHLSTGLWVLSMWGFLAAYTLLGAFALGIHQALPGKQGILGIAPWAIVVAVVFLNTLTLVVIGMALGLADAYSAASEAERVPLEAVALTLVHFENHTRALAYVFLSIGTLMLGLRVLLSSPASLPRWIGWTGTTGGVLGIAGSLRLGPEFLFVVSTTGNVVMLFAFALPASIALLRLQRVPEEIPGLEDRPPGAGV